jgi:putative ABC transport system substrate-binding protein
MRDLGYVEGRNITYKFRYYGDDIESIPSLINDLLNAKVDVIVAGGAPAIRAAQTATLSIPIVMGAVSDPLGIGLIAGLARPGGNTTGLSILSTELTVKRLELLREVMPQAVRIAILQQPANLIRGSLYSSKRSSRPPNCLALFIGFGKREGRKTSRRVSR